MRATNGTGRLGERPGQGGIGCESRVSITPQPLNVNDNDLWAAIDQAWAELGIIIKNPVCDGRLQRCAVEGGRPGNLDGAYRICTDAPANIYFQNFKTGQKGTFFFGSSSKTWSPAERREFSARVEEGRRQKEAEQRKAWDLAARKAERIYDEAAPCGGHPYLTAKGVLPHSKLRASGPDLIVPLLNRFGLVRSLQFIKPDGTKRFLAGGQKSGCFLNLDAGAADRSQTLLVCEGAATGLSLFESTGFEVLVSFDAGNLKTVALGARQDYPGREIVVCADNDAAGPVNIGAVKARATALAVGGRLSIPFLTEGQPCDFNDLHQAQGPETVQAFIEAAFSVGGPYA